MIQNVRRLFFLMQKNAMVFSEEGHKICFVSCKKSQSPIKKVIPIKEKVIDLWKSASLPSKNVRFHC